jgi:hypothetical protein
VAKTSLKEGRSFGGSPNRDEIVGGNNGEGAVNGDDTPRSKALGLKPKNAGDLDGEDDVGPNESLKGVNIWPGNSKRRDRMENFFTRLSAHRPSLVQLDTGGLRPHFPAAS